MMKARPNWFQYGLVTLNAQLWSGFFLTARFSGGMFFLRNLILYTEHVGTMMRAAKKSVDPNKPDYSALVPAVEQASRILLALAQAASSQLSLTEIARQVGIHKSKAYSILNTLSNVNFVQRDPLSKAYSLGTGLLFLAGRVLESLDLRDTARPFLKRLSESTNSTAFFGMISERHLLVVAKDEGDQDIGLTIRTGHRFPLAWGAHGKSIAAFLPRQEREALLKSDKLYFHGSPAGIDRRRLNTELQEFRRIGYATDLGEMKVGIHAVAAPVFGRGGTVIGALVVLGTFPKQMADQYGSYVVRAAREFSESIGGR